MEPLRQAIVIPIDEPTQVPVARRAAADVGRRLGLPEADLANLEIVTIELANNILQHAHASAPGEIFLSSDASGTAVQIVAADMGRGISNVERSLEDGFSTRDTPGTGLGAVRRLSHSFDIYSVPGKGTVASALVGLRTPDPALIATHAASTTPASADAAVLCTAIAGEVVSGDNWAIFPTPNGDVYLVVDGLGHGLQASEAALLGIDIFRKSLHLPPAAIVNAMHAGMRATRGAAVAVLAVDTTRRQVTCCGVGNISCLLQMPDGRLQSLISHNGTVGHQMRRVQEFQYTFLPQSLLILHSDGISANWKLSTYPDLFEHRPATVAGVLYRDAARRRDDATILVSRLSPHTDAVGPASSLPHLPSSRA
jgi:anti-sigma regulatory factor (Ser/Thr protein kinase)